ncbi:hypothetical protein Btaycd_011890, partial [Bartonella taylorii]
MCIRDRYKIPIYALLTINIFLLQDTVLIETIV